ncbi:MULTISPECIES: hypothetical protein [Paenalcaligenes]|uniref:Copper resistance protein NlpE N-terminal domain-containing protein n=1 Tax=Paenalcaligenes hermetiae TaxID=1157987 RepID=A0ABP9LS47_9BURK|nr:hypothetical protein [Paenalcaligenes sp.]
MHKKSLLRLWLPLCTLTTAAVLAGCAQNPVTSSPRGSLTEAQDHARGGRDKAKATSQVNFGLNQPLSQNKADGLTSGQIRELLEPRTFLGTMSCPPADKSCMPVRLVVTMSPEGVWRMRATDITQNVAPVTSEGCWHQIGSNPTRIVLMTQNETVFGDFSFMYDHQLRVNVFNYVRPTLETHLSRQPDIDPIEELPNHVGLNCRP